MSAGQNRRAPAARCMVLCLGLFLAAVSIGAQPAPAVQPQEPAPVAAGQDEPSLFSIQMTPGVEFPFQGSVRPLFSLSYGTDIVARLPLRGLPSLAPTAGLAYTIAPIRADTSISALGIGLGGSYVLDMGRVLVTATGLGGGYLSFFNRQQLDPDGDPYDNQAGAAGYFGAGVDASIFVTPYLSVGVGGLYHNFLGLYHAARVHLSSTLHLEGLRQQVGLRVLELEPAFPVLMQYYGSNSIGDVSITNGERFPMTNVSVELDVPGYMRRAKPTEVALQMQPGESAAAPLYALFRENVLDLIEGVQVPAEITVSYELNGKPRTVSSVQTLRLHHRNALTWDDDRKAAAFVMSKDVEVIRFASAVAAMVRREGPAAVNPNLRMGIGLFNAVSEYGLSYVVDPSQPAYVDASANARIIDFLKFPRQTLHFRGGDCDDLSILYCALLESVGVPSAFITIPGHIYAAFSLGVSTHEARQFLFDDRSVIDVDGTAWVPVEVTLVGEDFREAWETGARQWREHVEAGETAFFTNHGNWQTYPAAGWTGEEIVITLPDPDAVYSRYNREIIELVQRQLMPQIAAIRDQMAGSRNPVRYMNRMGVLYAQYGMLDEAAQTFQAALLQEEYPPVLLNLGNLHYVRGELRQALEYFERAAAVRPDDPAVLLNLARINTELEQYAQGRAYFAQLEEADPELSAEFAYLGTDQAQEGARAADVELQQSRVFWDGGELPEEAE